MGALRTYINMLAPQLTSLSVLHPIPHLPHNFLDKILLSCLHLLRLTASVDFMTAHIFDEENCVAEHPIERIDLDCSGGMGSEFKISSDDISIALMEGRLRRLRIVRASKRLGWARRSEEKKRVEDLAELLIMDRSGFGEENEEEGSQEDDDMRSEYVMVEKEDPVVDIVGTDDDEDGVEDELSRKFAGVYIF
ncbi:hypothetical protein TWF106_003657 [Orbilia oligospora]|nr:hypothetical protein TWF679_003644 [Orbilia oligospora]KAF3224693.1 hypothetical protein TWF106_003657 [Orbilia oligospora]KAF3229096.1 hypothetical protein TWF191_001649 [Orbilia oligospora]KAF3232118.1 hypothetical protein TWF192_003351 [Orbilia oligospora]